MITELLKPILTILISFALRWFFALIGVEIDEGVFNAIVAGIVLWLLTLIGAESARQLMPRLFK